MGDTATQERIRPELAHLAVPIQQVSNWPGNPRRGDIAKIKTSLQAHGQYTPILVQRSTGHAVKGNNTLIAATELGWTSIAVQHLDLDDEQARRILLLDNKTSDDASYDDRALALLLAEYGQDNLDGTGWSTAELDDLLKATDLLGDSATTFLDELATQDPPPQQAAAPPSQPPPVPTPAAAAQAAASATPAEVPIPAAVAPSTDPTAPAAPPPVQYVQMSWTCTPEQRETVRAALAHLQQTRSLGTAVEALVALAQFYLDQASVEEPA